MLDIPRLTELFRSISSGARLHRRALAKAHAGHHQLAERLFEAAAELYRRELEVEALARLRVHQMMARVLSGSDPHHEAQTCLEVERRLCRFERIESPRPPFDFVDARTVLAAWLKPALGATDGHEDSEQRSAA